MLVVICAIRKVMECVFSKRELRLLDDLLPESNKNVRKGGRGPIMIKQFSRKKQNKDKVADADQELKAYRAAWKKKAKEIGFEVEHLSLKPSSRKKPAAPTEAVSPNAKMLRRRRSSIDSIRSSPPMAKAKCTIFVKMAGSKAYLPIILRRKTVHGLLNALKLKCPGSFQHTNIVNMYKQNCKGLVFHLDDDMMEYVDNQQIYDIELQERCDEPEKYDMTLAEVSL